MKYIKSDELLMYNPFKTQVQAALTASHGGFSFTSVAEPHMLSIDHLLSAAANGRMITEMDIRADYLQQLTAMERSRMVDKDELNQALFSAYHTPIHVSVADMMKASEQELGAILTNRKALGSLLTDKLLGQYGLLGAVAIKLQDPRASRLFSYREVQSKRVSISSGVSPIHVFTPTQREYFRRNGKLIPKAHATEKEILGMIDGSIKTQTDIQYVLNHYYDVGQLNISEIQRGQLLCEYETEGKPTYEEMKSFAVTLSSENNRDLRVEEIPMNSFSSSSIFDTEQFVVYIKAGLHESEKLDELVTRIAEVFAESTCTGIKPVRDLQTELLNVQLRNKWNLPIPSSTPDRIFDRFHEAVPEIVKSGDYETISLESFTNTANRMCRFITQSASEFIISDTEVVQEQSLQQQQAFSAQQAIKSATANFMVGV